MKNYLICMILLFIVYHLIFNQNILLHYLVSDFHLVMTDDVNQSLSHRFDHYNYDVIRALSWMRKNVSLVKKKKYNICNIQRILSSVSGCENYTAFVNASIAYLQMCKIKVSLVIGVVINMRHNLIDIDACGNYIRLELFNYNPLLSPNENAKTLKMCISQGKQKKTRDNNLKLISKFLRCNVIINSWGVKDDTQWFIAPPVKQKLVPILYDGRKRFAVICNLKNQWYVRYECLF